jgi:hypothetical protein
VFNCGDILFPSFFTRKGGHTYLKKRLDNSLIPPPYGGGGGSFLIESHIQFPKWGGEMVVDTQTSMPCDKSHEAQNAFKDWMIHEECRSHYVSQFAAFFIVARAKRSIVKSCLNVFYIAYIHTQTDINILQRTNTINQHEACVLSWWML